MVWLSQPYCWLMGSTAMLIFTRSMLHSMKAKKQSVTMVHRRFQNGWLTAAWVCERQAVCLRQARLRRCPQTVVSCMADGAHTSHRRRRW